MKLNLWKKYSAMPQAVRTSIWFTFCQFLQRGIALITVPIFTRLLTTEEYGICNIYFTWFDIFLLFTSLRIPYEGLNNGLIRYEEDKDRYTSSVMGLIMVMTGAGAAIYLLFRRWIDPVTGLSSFIMMLMFIQLLFNPPLMLWTNRERFDFRYQRPVVVTVISTVLNLLITIVAVLVTSYKAEARIIGSVAVQTVFGIIFFFVLLAKGKSLFQKKYWSFAFRFNLPLIAFYLSQMILNQSDRLMINYFEGSGKAAIYSVAYSAATIMQIALSAINGSFNPWMYKKLKKGSYSDVGFGATMLSLLVAGATLLVSALAPDLVRIFATETYMEAIWIIAPVSASVFFVFLYTVFANVEMYYGMNGAISVISVICSVLNVVLNYIFIPIYGYFAAGWTTLVSYILLTFLHFVLMRRACRRNGIREHLFQEHALLFISIGVVVLSFAALLMYCSDILRYSVMILAVVVILMFRKKITALIRQFRRGA